MVLAHYYSTPDPKQHFFFRRKLYFKHILEQNIVNELKIVEAEWLKHSSTDEKVVSSNHQTALAMPVSKTANLSSAQVYIGKVFIKWLVLGSVY